jgi:hypothetical protein
MTKILRTKLGGIVGAARPHHVRLIADAQHETIGAHGRKMSAARDEADVNRRACQLHAEVAANRASAVDADLHGILRGWKYNFGAKRFVALMALIRATKPGQLRVRAPLSGGHRPRRRHRLVVKRG